MADPRNAFLGGVGLFTAVLTIAWAISGERLDGFWLSQLWMAAFCGFAWAGISARQFSSPFHPWISRGALSLLFAGSAIFTYCAGYELYIFASGTPVFSILLVVGVLTLLYHATLGVLHLLLLTYLHRFVYKHG